MLGSPILAAVCSLLSLSLSIAALVLSSKVEMMRLIGTVKQYASIKSIGFAAVSIGAMSPLWTLFQVDYKLIELLFWSIPLIIISMYYLAYHMMSQVYEGLDELEGSRYKYKGA